MNKNSQSQFHHTSLRVLKHMTLHSKILLPIFNIHFDQICNKTEIHLYEGWSISFRTDDLKQRKAYLRH